MTISFQGCSEYDASSAYGVAEPSAATRITRASEPNTTSNVPSGSQSKQNGNDGIRATTSHVPSASTASSSPAIQSERCSRPSCQRGDSPIAMPVVRISMLVRPETGRVLIVARSGPPRG